MGGPASIRKVVHPYQGVAPWRGCRVGDLCAWADLRGGLFLDPQVLRKRGQFEVGFGMDE